MRRSDRQITDFDRILSIIDECDIIRIGLNDGEFPYIVPLNFGYVVSGKNINFYVHGATEGRKFELMNKNGFCSFEMDVPLELDCVAEKKYATMRYRSVMGTAKITFLDGEQKQKGIDILMQRYEKTRNFDYNRAVVQNTAVARLSVIDITAKENRRKD